VDLFTYVLQTTDCGEWWTRALCNER